MTQTFKTADAFLDWLEGQQSRHELVDGVVRLMAGGSRNHAVISVNLTTSLANRLSETPCTPFNSDYAVILDDLNVFLPDASVRCGKEDAPVVIFEVLSPSTAAYDLGQKATAYRRLSELRHLVLVSQDRVHVEHFSRREGETDFAVQEIDRMDKNLKLDAIGVKLPVAEIYRGVSLN